MLRTLYSKAAGAGSRSGSHGLARAVERLSNRSIGGGRGRRLLARINPFEDIPGQRQADQFRLQRTLWRLGLGRVEDPLFECAVIPSSGGRFSADLVYRGLRVRGVAKGTELVELVLDGRVIRGDRIEAPSRGRSFWLYVNRPALSLFPRRSELLVRSTSQEGRAPREERFQLEVPHGSGKILEALGGATMDKKGNVPLSAEALSRRQEELLSLYQAASRAFRELTGRPLFLLYGTLLGLHRDGDLIPGDDDFDVGYLSRHEHPRAVKREAKEIITRLVGAGFDVTLNRKGKPLRLHGSRGGPELHLDVCPVWGQDGKVWMNPYGGLDMRPDAFAAVERRSFRGVTVELPRGTEEFLRSYYGPGWRRPDPEYTLTRSLSGRAKRTLAAVCLSSREAGRLQAAIDDEATGHGGRLYSKALQDLYPLDRYEAVCGWD